MRPEMEGLTGVLAMLVPFGSFAVIVLIVWIRTRLKQGRLQTEADLRRQMLEKFGSGQELADFLETESGREFFRSFGSGHIGPKEKILKKVHTGVVLLALGIAGVILTTWKSALLAPGVVCIALGIGFLLGAAITHRLSAKLGLLTDEPEAGSMPSADKGLQP